MLSAPLEAIRAELEEASSRARSVLESIPQDVAGRRPSPTAWSPAECIAHLTLTTDAYAPGIREALARGRQQNLTSSRERFRMDGTARLLAWWLEPPYRLKSKTPAAFVPGSDDSASVLRAFLERQQQLFGMLREADGLAIDQLRIESPFARQMHYSVYSAFRLITAHQRRHLWQAEQALAAIPEGR